MAPPPLCRSAGPTPPAGPAAAAAKPPGLLMIAFHFPPAAVSSGVQRSLRLARHLPHYGWQPLVLSAAPYAYPRRDPGLLAQLPPELEVLRAPALDCARHLALAGRYPAWLARPDRWRSWWLPAVAAGLYLIWRRRPRAIWSTHPIPTAHAIGATLARLSGLPWIADLRDPMAHEGYPPEPAQWQAHARVERQVFARAAAVVTVTEGCADYYRARYPQAAARIEVIANGYDEAAFAALTPAAGPLNPGRLTLVHSGVVYPHERDPRPLFAALAQLARSGWLAASGLALRFRASEHDDLLATLAATAGVQPWVEILPPLPYAEALAEMQRADGLLLLQGASCNTQIPAKLYEYLRAGRPLLCLADPAGDSWRAAQAAGCSHYARIDDAQDIARALAAFVAALAAGNATAAAAPVVAAAEYGARAAALAALLERLCPLARN